MGLKIKISPCKDGSYELEIPEGLTIDCNHWWHDPTDPNYKEVKPPPEETVFQNKLKINFIENPPKENFFHQVSFEPVEKASATQKKVRRKS